MEPKPPTPEELAKNKYVGAKKKEDGTMDYSQAAIFYPSKQESQEAEKKVSKKYEKVMKDRNISFDDVTNYFDDRIMGINKYLTEEKDKISIGEKVEEMKRREIFRKFLYIASNFEEGTASEFEQMLETIEDLELGEVTHYKDYEDYDENGKLKQNIAVNYDDEYLQNRQHARDMSALLTAKVYENDKSKIDINTVKYDLKVIFERFIRDAPDEGTDKASSDGWDEDRASHNKALKGLDVGNYDWTLKLIEESITDFAEAKQGKVDDEYIVHKYGIKKKTLKKLRQARDFLTSPSSKK